MSELKALHIPTRSGNSLLCYIKSEADKVIEDLIEKNKRLANMDIIMARETIKDLEERHKKEVGQLLIEIEELKEEFKNSRNARKYWRKEYLIEYKECCSQKYRRCLKMAELCKARYDVEDAKNNGCGLSWVYISKEMKYWERWHKRWLELAEKFNGEQ